MIGIVFFDHDVCVGANLSIRQAEHVRDSLTEYLPTQRILRNRRERQRQPRMAHNFMSEREDLPSASSFGRLANCPKSFSFEAQLRAQGITQAPQIWTEQGTEIAAALEHGDLSALGESVLPVAERLDRITSEALSDWCLRHDSSIDRVVEFREQRWWLRDRNMNLVVSAQVDRAYIDPNIKCALIIDHKSGYLDVDSAHANWQLRVQAVCMNHEHGDEILEAEVAIAQGRFKGKFDNAVYSSEALAHAKAEILHAIWKSKQPDAPAYPGEWCRYCIAKDHCRPGIAWAWVDFFDIPNQEHLYLKSLPSLTAEQCRNVFARMSIGQLLLDAVKTRLKAMAPDELAELGLFLSPTGNVTTITSKDEASKLLRDLLSEMEFEACCDPKMTRIIEAVAARFGWTKAVAEQTVRDSLAPALKITPKEKSLKIVKGFKP